MTTHVICKHPESIRDQSRTSQRTDQSFVKELAKPTQDKIVFKKFPYPSKKIKNTTHNPTDNDTETQH